MSSLIVISVMIFIPAIQQDPAYHLFVDARLMLGVSNLLNVVSNIPFLFIGLLGVVLIIRNSDVAIILEQKWSYLIFFVGVLLVSLGSGYYHLNPSNETLVWDRLPMTIAFMAFFSIILSEFISVKVGRILFIPLIVIGLFSIWYWNYTEQNGTGDLRLYALVQFLPMLLIPIILLSFRCRFTLVKYYWFFLAMYVLAKLMEMFDAVIYDYLVFISGHSIKHLLASLGCIIFYYQLKRRNNVAD